MAALALVGCAAAPRVAAPATVATGPAAHAVTEPIPVPRGRTGQWLFRAEISGEEGAASLRLLLRRFDAERFTLTAADALGQARWEVRGDTGEASWLDPQAKLFCRLDPRRPMPARLGVPGVALVDFPGLLIGEWPPAELVAPSPTETSAARPFTAERGNSGALWGSWTLWEEGEPVAWFKRLDPDSLLSVRRPSVQVRWRVTGESDLARPADEPGGGSRAAAAPQWPGVVPAGAQERICPDNAIP